MCKGNIKILKIKYVLVIIVQKKVDAPKHIHLYSDFC